MKEGTGVTMATVDPGTNQHDTNKVEKVQQVTAVPVMNKVTYTVPQLQWLHDLI